jgi:hypothetical protein
MSLINCPECGHSVSNKAIACPNCGFPIKPDERTAIHDSITTVDGNHDDSMSQDGDDSEFLCGTEQASSQPPPLEIAKTIIVSSNPDEAQHTHTDTSLQQRTDFPAVSQPHFQHTENAIKKNITNKNRVRWVRIMFWILWPIAIFFLTATALKIKTSTGGSFADGAAAGGLLGTAVGAYALVGIPCAMLELIVCMFRKRKDPSIRLPIRNLVIPVVILILVAYGVHKSQKIIAKSAHEKRNRIESEISHKKKEDAQFEKELKSLKEFRKSRIDDQQEELNALNSGLEIKPEPLKERFERLSEIADSSTGYRGLITKMMVKGMKELSAIGQDYQKAASEYTEASKHDIQHLHDSRKSLMRCRSLLQKQNMILTNYREFLERAIPKKPETIPFKDFDQNLYAVARIASIDGGCKTVTPTNLASCKTEEEIWDLKIAQVDLLIEKFTYWEISPDGSTLFDNESDLNKLNGLQEQLRQAGDRLANLAEKMLNEQRERIKN